MRAATGGRERWATAVLVALALMLLPASAGAQCSTPVKSGPKKDVSAGPAPYAIGDSPMVLAVPNIAKIGYRVNARVCRFMYEGLDILRERRDEGKLSRLTVISLGANGSVTKADIHEALRLIRDRRGVRMLGLMTPREKGGGESSDARIMRKEAERHRRIVLLDWVRYSAGHPEWFASDGLHLTSEGAAAMARLMKKPLKDLPPPHRVHERRRACGGVEKSYPKKNVSRGPAPLAVGDSPMLLALPNLADIGYRANARGCRQYPEGLAVLKEYKHRGRLPRLVVVALGSNGVVTKDDIHDALDLVGRKRTLGLVTPRESGGGSGADATIVRDEAHKHKNRIVLLDWVNKSAGHSSWFQPDGLHLTFEGAENFAKLLRRPLKDLPPPNHH